MLLNKFHDLLQPYGKREQDSSIQQKKMTVARGHSVYIVVEWAWPIGRACTWNLQLDLAKRQPQHPPGVPVSSSQLTAPSSTCNTGQPTSLADPGEIFNAESLIAIAAASAAAHFRHLLVFRLHFPQSQDLQHRTWTAHRLMVDIIKFDARHLLTTAPCLGGFRPGCQDARMPGCHVARTHFHQPAFEWPRN